MHTFFVIKIDEKHKNITQKFHTKCPYKNISQILQPKFLHKICACFLQHKLEKMLEVG